MTTEERQRRPIPPRTAPQRTFVKHDHPGDKGQAEATSTSSPPPDGVQEVIHGAVKLGYSVVDEHLEHGRQAAQRIRSGSYTSADIETDVGLLVERLARTAKEMTAAWLEIMSVATKTTVAAAPAGPSARAPISVRVQSARPAQVTLDLHPLSPQFVPAVHALYPKPPGQGVLTDVKFALHPERAHATLTVTIPDDLPAGIYAGVITDSATHQPGGTVCVHVDPKD
jgi:hypothetical protein